MGTRALVVEAGATVVSMDSLFILAIYGYRLKVNRVFNLKAVTRNAGRQLSHVYPLGIESAQMTSNTMQYLNSPD